MLRFSPHSSWCCSPVSPQLCAMCAGSVGICQSVNDINLKAHNGLRNTRSGPNSCCLLHVPATCIDCVYPSKDGEFPILFSIVFTVTMQRKRYYDDIFLVCSTHLDIALLYDCPPLCWLHPACPPSLLRMPCHDGAPCQPPCCHCFENARTTPITTCC